MRLVNKVALITGAGGPMGRAIAQKLACEGASLVLTDISGTRLNAWLAAFSGAQGGSSVHCKSLLRSSRGSQGGTSSISKV